MSEPQTLLARSKTNGQRSTLQCREKLRSAEQAKSSVKISRHLETFWGLFRGFSRPCQIWSMNLVASILQTLQQFEE